VPLTRYANNVRFEIESNLRLYAPGSSASSIAAVVGNTDPSCTKYVARLSAQANRKEIIEDLENMSFEILHAYFTAQGGAGRQGSRPARVIFYRDGVSEAGHGLRV